jgi:hypothetical protein
VNSYKLTRSLALAGFLSLAVLKPLVALAATAYWVEPRSNVMVDRQVAADIGQDAGLVVLRARLDNPTPAYRYPELVKKLKGSGKLPVLSYAWANRFTEGGRVETELLRGLKLGQPLASAKGEGGRDLNFLDVTNPSVRSTVVNRMVNAQNELGIDGFAFDLSIRLPAKRPDLLAQRCKKEADFCPNYAAGMDKLFAELRQGLTGNSYLAFNGLWNFEPESIKDQERLFANANAAAVEYFGMDPNDRNHSFTHDILPFINAMQQLPPDKFLLVFGRGSWKYTDYAEDFNWQRYLYSSFMLGARSKDLFKYHSSFQAPAHAGRSGSLDHYADWKIALGQPVEPMTHNGGLYARHFSNGWVFVAPDDGPGGSFDPARVLYTPEGEAVDGRTRVEPGRALILLTSRPKSRQPEKVISAADISRWGWAQAKLNGDAIRLDDLPAELLGEHDLLLDSDRSLTPYRQLRLAVSLPTPKSRIYAVAEIDDPKKEYTQVMVEIGDIQKSASAIRLGPLAPFRSQSLTSHPETVPILSMPVAAGGKAIDLDGSNMLAGAGYKFRRWSYLRFDGPADVTKVVLSQPQSAVK